MLLPLRLAIKRVNNVHKSAIATRRAFDIRSIKRAVMPLLHRNIQTISQPAEPDNQLGKQAVEIKLDSRHHAPPSTKPLAKAFMGLAMLARWVGSGDGFGFFGVLRFTIAL